MRAREERAAVWRAFAEYQSRAARAAADVEERVKTDSSNPSKKRNASSTTNTAKPGGINVLDSL